MNPRLSAFLRPLQWLTSRIAVIYIVLFVLILTCVDIHTVEKRNKIRHLNGISPDFTQMNNFLTHQVPKPAMNWVPYKNYFELVLRYMPQDAIAQELLGYVYYYMGQENKAIALLKSASNFSDNLFWPNYNLGVIYYKKGMYEQSFDYMSKAIAANPQGTVGYMYSSVMYRQIFFRYSSKLDVKEQLNDAFGLAYILMEASLQHLQRYDQMLMIAASAVSHKEFPYQDAHALYAGIACLELRQADKAVLLFERSLNLEKNNPLVYVYLAQIYKAIGKEQAGQELLKISQDIRMKNEGRFPYDQNIELRYF